MVELGIAAVTNEGRGMKSMRRVMIVLMVVAVCVGACAKKKLAPVASAAPPPAAAPAAAPAPAPPPRPAERLEESVPVPAISEDAIGNRSLEDLNRDSPFKPAFFGLDSFELDDAGRAIVSGNADIMKKYPSWVVTVEGHCDERGTAEYNLALGERRAVAVKTYLVALGISPDRLRTVSYGKEFPFDMGHAETAWSQNRRAHFVITSK
jgi:peptidoglycan-associated lipoprotein